MAAIADITVKMADGVTNIVWTGMVPSSGSDPAVWRSLSVGTAPGHKPEFRLASRDSGKGSSARVMRGTLKYPQIATNTTTGITAIVNEASMSVDFVMPKGMAQTDLDQFAAQSCALLYSALVQTSIKAGYAPT